MTSVAIKGIRRSVLGGFTSNKGDQLVLTPGFQSVPITWELVKHLNLQVSPQTYWIRKVESLCFISSLGDSDSCPRLRTTGRGMQEGFPKKIGGSEKEEGQKYHPRGRSRENLVLLRNWMWWEQRKSKCRREWREAAWWVGPCNLWERFCSLYWSLWDTINRFWAGKYFFWSITCYYNFKTFPYNLIKAVNYYLNRAYTPIQDKAGYKYWANPWIYIFSINFVFGTMRGMIKDVEKIRLLLSKDGEPGWEDKTKRKVPDTPNGLGWQDARDWVGTEVRGHSEKAPQRRWGTGLAQHRRRTLEESVEAEICKEFLCIRGKGWAGVLRSQREVLEKTLSWE